MLTRPHSRHVILLLVGIAFSLGGCGKQAEPVAAAPSPGLQPPAMETDLARTIKEQADFYVFKTAADLPADLTWQDGLDLPVFADPEAKKGGTFHMSLPDFPRTLRTVGPDASGGVRGYLRDYTEPSLVKTHPNRPDAVMPGLADRWAVSTSTRTVYYHLDPRARWSDGRPLTTDDVVFTFYFNRSPHLRDPWYNDFYTANFRQLIIFDTHTFAFVHPENKPDLAARFGDMVPYPRHAFQDFGADWLERFQWRALPRIGAYELLEKDIEKGRAITLNRVKNWWGENHRFLRGRFNPDRYRLEVIRDPDKSVEAFARGDLDLVSLGTPKFWFETLPDTHPEVTAGRIVRFKFYNRIPRPDWGIWINCAKPLLDTLDVRLGLHHAIDIDLVCTQYFRGDAERLQTRSDGYSWRTHPTLVPRPYDPEKARALFAKAGFARQGDDGVLIDGSGRRLSFTLTTGRQEFRDMLPILKQQAMKAGLELRLEVLDSTTGFKKVQEKNHEISLLALNRAVELYPRYWERYHGSNAYTDAYSLNGKPVTTATGSVANPHPTQVKTQTNNMTMTFLPELDRLIEAYDRAESLSELKRLAEQIEATIHADAGWIPGWKLPFYRGAYWRHIKWPKGFNVMQSRTPEEYFVHWIDPEEKKSLDEARRTGRTYPAELQVFDQFRER
ncbi:MAG: extracellular solute-binding protein [Opitutaceae bacterium]